MRWLRYLSIPLLLLASCVVSPQPSPPNLNPEGVDTDSQATDMTDGPRIIGAAGTIDPPEGVVVATNLDEDLPPRVEPVRDDGGFEIVAQGSLMSEYRLQARIGSRRSIPFDFVITSGDRVVDAARPLDCLHLAPEYELDFGDVRVGDRREASLNVQNDCTEDVSISAPRLREAETPFETSGDPRVLTPGSSASIIVAVTPIEPGAIEATVFIEATAPMRDRRPITLFVRGTE